MTKNTEQNNDFYKIPDEVLLSPEESKKFSTINNADLIDLTNILQLQSDISVTKAKEITILTAWQILKNIKQTAIFLNDIQKRCQDIKETIDHIEKLQDQKSGLHGFILEQHLPLITDRYNKLMTRIDMTKKQSLTNTELSHNEENALVEERRNIIQKINKFEEDLREYL